MPAKPKPTPPQTPTLPIETMASVLSASGADLADDAACIQALIASGFASGDVYLGLSAAQDRARELSVEAV